jgi:hypothetical protein
MSLAGVAGREVDLLKPAAGLGVRLVEVCWQVGIAMQTFYR